MATKKQMEELQAQIDELKTKLAEKDEALSFMSFKARSDMLTIHNGINNFLRTFDECEGDFWVSDITKMRELREKMRKEYTIEPPKDSEGVSLHYAYEWVLKEV